MGCLKRKYNEIYKVKYNFGYIIFQLTPCLHQLHSSSAYSAGHLEEKIKQHFQCCKLELQLISFFVYQEKRNAQSGGNTRLHSISRIAYRCFLRQHDKKFYNEAICLREGVKWKSFSRFLAGKDCNATPGPLLSGHAQTIYFNDAMSITKR